MKLRLVSFLLAIIFLINGCVVAVVAGAAAGLIAYDRRSLSMIEKDSRLFQQIHTEMVHKTDFATSRIIITSFNQVVLLVGQARNPSLRIRAEKTAYNVAEVRRVYNEITVGYPISVMQRAEDSWITGQIRSRLLAKKGLESGSIRIVTENAIVYLMGIATHEQADLAANLAREVNNVRKVVKLFQYIT